MVRDISTTDNKGPSQSLLSKILKASSRKSSDESSHTKTLTANALTPNISNAFASNIAVERASKLTDAISTEVTSTEATPNDTNIPDTLSTATGSDPVSSNVIHLRTATDAKSAIVKALLSVTTDNADQSIAVGPLASANTIEQDPEQPEALTLNAANEDTKESNTKSLWDRAWEALKEKDPQSKHLLILEENFNRLETRDTIANDIAKIVEEKQFKARGKDGISESDMRQISTQFAKFIMPTSSLAMGLARFDIHGIAPIVLGGVYTVFQFIKNDSDDRRTALPLTLDIANIVALWNSVEKFQISKNLNTSLEDLYEKLKDNIIELYKRIMVLLGTMLAYFDKGRWGQIFAVIVPHDPKWARMQNEMKSFESNCNNIKSQITLRKENEAKESKTLTWISKHDIRGSYNSVLGRTGVVDRYNARSKWLIEHHKFKKWYNAGTSSVLWLTGTIGTGKTTLMARAIQEIQKSTMIEIDAMPFAIFFFNKTSKPRVVDMNTCLHSLIRQLSWNNATAQIDKIVRKEFDNVPDQLRENSYTGNCLDLLTQLLSKRETYIMIDGIDECEDPQTLLMKLKEVEIGLNNKHVNRLHIMLCGKNDTFVENVFKDCPKITTSSAKSKEDQDYYIDTEIDRIRPLQQGSLFFSPENDYPDRLRGVLKRKCSGVFRWAEIQLEIFATLPFGSADQIEDELQRLESHTATEELDEEYARLFKGLEKMGRNQERAMKMLKLIACADNELSFDDLAEAITASEHGSSDAKLTRDNIRRILVGFVHVRRTKMPGITFHPTIHLAHSSVLEYLMNEKINLNRFSILAQHSEAALFCFSRISYLQQAREGLRANPESSSDQPTRVNMTNFLQYSCSKWPDHCRRAFEEAKNCPLVESTRNFILNGGYGIWNALVRDHSTSLGSSEPLFYKIWHHGPSPKPGFVIALFDLIDLLDISEIRALISLQDVNGYGETLFHHSLKCATSSMITRLVELYPQQVKPSEGKNDLMLAIRRNFVDIVERLLENSEGIHVRQLDRSLLSIAAMEARGLFTVGLLDEYNTKLRIIQILLKKGADIYEIDHDGQTITHLAAIYGVPRLLNLFIEQAIQLDENEQRGSVQRILRMRDNFGNMPAAYAASVNAQYLRDRLDEAVRRDRRVMHDFDSLDLAETESWEVDDIKKMKISRAQKYFGRAFR